MEGKKASWLEENVTALAAKGDSFTSFKSGRVRALEFLLLKNGGAATAGSAHLQGNTPRLVVCPADADLPGYQETIAKKYVCRTNLPLDGIKVPACGGTRAVAAPIPIIQHSKTKHTAAGVWMKFRRSHEATS